MLDWDLEESLGNHRFSGWSRNQRSELSGALKRSQLCPHILSKGNRFRDLGSTNHCPLCNGGLRSGRCRLLQHWRLKSFCAYRYCLKSIKPLANFKIIFWLLMSILSNFSREMAAAIFCPNCYGGLRSHCLDLLDDRLNLGQMTYFSFSVVSQCSYPYATCLRSNLHSVAVSLFFITVRWSRN